MNISRKSHHRLNPEQIFTMTKSYILIHTQCMAYMEYHSPSWQIRIIWILNFMQTNISNFSEYSHLISKRSRANVKKIQAMHFYIKLCKLIHSTTHS